MIAINGLGNCLANKPKKNKAAKDSKKCTKRITADVGSDYALTSVTKRCELVDKGIKKAEMLEHKSAIKVCVYSNTV